MWHKFAKFNVVANNYTASVILNKMIFSSCLASAGNSGGQQYGQNIHCYGLC